MANFTLKNRASYEKLGKDFFKLVHDNPLPENGNRPASFKKDVVDLILKYDPIDPANNNAPCTANDFKIQEDDKKKANMNVPSTIDDLVYLKEDAQFLCNIADADEQAHALLGLYLMKRCR